MDSTTWHVHVSVLVVVVACLCSPTPALRQPVCPHNQGHTAANCSGRGLSVVPWQLHKLINSMDLSNNLFHELGDNSFIDYHYLTQLYLRNNSMGMIKPEAFNTLTFLRTLDLSNNKLSQVPVEAVDVVSQSLKYLVLAGNTLSYIGHGAFSRLHNLLVLDLSGNSIYHVEDGGFAGLFSLQVLKLRHNALKRLPASSFRDFPPESLSQVQLYHNRWVCDCQTRWLWDWLNATDPAVWESPGYAIRCEGPSMVRGQALNQLPLDTLMCEARMKISGSSRTLSPGSNTTLKCRYWSVPWAKAVWMKNSEAVDEKDGRKYEVTSWQVTGKNDTYSSQLTIRDFRYADIAKYRCLVENLRGSAHTDYRLTLHGVDFDSVVVLPSVEDTVHSQSGGVDTMSIVIAVAVVCGIVLIIAIAVLIFCSVNRMQRKKQAKRDVIVQHVKEHFIKNSEDNGTIDANGKPKPSPLTLGLDDGMGGGGGGSLVKPCPEDDRASSVHTNDSTYKAPLDLEEAEPMLIMSGGGGQSPGSPLNNGNTYVSFGSEFTDPGEFTSHVPLYQPHPHPPTTPNMGSRYGLHGGAGPGGGSHEGSATPLLDRYTPIFVDDADEPMEDYASFPVYDSLTNSLQHPRLTPPPNLPGTGMLYHNGGGDGIYGTSPLHYTAPPYPRPAGSVSSRNGNLDRSLGSSSFHYPPSNPPSNPAGSLPRTPGSVRSMSAMAPPPWNASSGMGDGSPPIIENHYQPPPMLHRPHPQYRDYRDMRYPPAQAGGSNPGPPRAVTPPAHRAVATHKGVAYSPVPSSGPRKPPRVYIPGANGRECMELTPAHDPGHSSDYITSSEAQQYSQNYGITPGTPV